MRFVDLKVQAQRLREKADKLREDRIAVAKVLREVRYLFESLLEAEAALRLAADKMDPPSDEEMDPVGAKAALTASMKAIDDLENWK